jgi:ABC-type transport system substrate-binding protein
MNIYPGWWSDEESLSLAAELLAESDFDARYAIWEQIQANAYTQVPAIKTGDSSNCAFYSETVGGWPEQIENGVPFWNLWFAS